MKNRLLIFSVYDKDGIIDRYIEYLLNSFRECTSRIVVVVNGQLLCEEKRKLLQYTSEILVRDNKGFDAGAYKDAIAYLGKDVIRVYDEVILCNDTCYGPFIPFQKMFEEMKQDSCDFWGIHYTDRDRLSYLCSYFLTFREKILMEDVWFEYFENHIDESTEEISDVHVQFETGLFAALQKRYSYGIYTKWDNLSVTKSPDIAIIKYGFPVMKRRVFREKLFFKENAYNALRYVAAHGYDISMISENIKRLYDIKLDINEILEGATIETEEYYLEQMVINAETIREFCSGNKDVYIYGCGMYAKKIYTFYNDCLSNFRGFVVSDGQSKKEMQYGYRVVWFSEIESEKVKIILGLDANNTKEVLLKVTEKCDVLQMWK